jgi:hypothetical protein
LEGFDYGGDDVVSGDEADAVWGSDEEGAVGSDGDVGGWGYWDFGGS